jgi:NTP pyrophosphatase (non-canonical NTP hydrolase)
MIDRELEARIAKTIDMDRSKVRMASIEELMELAQVLAKTERFKGWFVERDTKKTVTEKLIEEIADVLVCCVMLWNIYGLRDQIYDQIHAVVTRYEKGE